MRLLYRLFYESMTVSNPGISGDDLTMLREKEFVKSLLEHVRDIFFKRLVINIIDKFIL